MYNHFSHIPSPQASSTLNPAMSQGMLQLNDLNTPAMGQTAPLPHTTSLGMEVLHTSSAQSTPATYKFTPQQQWASPNRPAANQPQLLSEFTPSPETNVLSLGSQPTSISNPAYAPSWPPGLNNVLPQTTLAQALAMASGTGFPTLTGHPDIRLTLPHGSMPALGNGLAHSLSPQATAGSAQFSGIDSTQAYRSNNFLAALNGHWNSNQMMNMPVAHQGLVALPSQNLMAASPSGPGPNPGFSTSMATALTTSNGSMPGFPALVAPYNAMSTDPRMLLPGSVWPNTTLQSATMNSSQHSPPFQLAAQPSENAAAMVHLQRQLLLRQQQAQALALAGVGHVGTGAYLAGATRRSMALSAPTPSSPPAKRQRTGGTQPEATSKRQPKATPTRKQPLTSTRICPQSQNTAAPQSSATPLQLTPMVATAGPIKTSSSLPNVSTPLPLEAVTPTLSIPLPSNTSQPPLANSANGPASQPLFHTFQATALPFSASGATGSSPGFSSAAQRSSPGPAKIRMKKPSVPTPRLSRSKLALDRLHKMQVSVPMDITKPRSKAASPPPQPMLTVPGTAPTQPVASQGLEATMVTLPGPLPLSPGLNTIASTNGRLASDGSLANKPLESLTAPVDLPNAIDEVPKSHHLLDSTLTPPDDSLSLFQFGNSTASLSTSAPSFASFAALMAGDTETSEAKPLRPTVSRSTTVSTDTVPSESVLDPSLHDAFDADTLTTLTAATSENHPAIPTSTASTIADQIGFAGADSLLDLDRQLEDIAEFLEKDVDLLTPVASKSMITTASSTHTDAANSLLSSSRPLSFPLTSPHHGMATQEDGVGAVSFANADTLLESVASSADQPLTGALDTPAAASIARSGNTRLQGLQLPDLVLEEGMGVLDSDSDDP